MTEYIGDYVTCGSWLRQRLAEPAPGRIQLLTGPRQVGKTNLLLALAKEWSEAAIYAACDDSNALLPGFWERTWQDAEAASARGPALLLLDEVQQLPHWAERLKARWDRCRRLGKPIHVIATGSSALRVAADSRESLAGRFERIVIGHWSAAALIDAFHLAPAEAAEAVVRFGGYPGAYAYRHDLGRWREYLRYAIVEPAIGRDVLALGQVRRPALLRQVFVVAAQSPAQIISLQKLQGHLLDRGALETIAHYLQLLQDAYLVAGLQRYSERGHRQRAAPPKLVTLNNALLAASLVAEPPEAHSDPVRFGAWVENACLAHAINRGQRVSYWREGGLETDGVCEGSWGDWAIEVKTGRFDSTSLVGLLEFCRRFRKFRPLVIGNADRAGADGLRGVVVQDWREFLIAGPPA